MEEVTKSQENKGQCGEEDLQVEKGGGEVEESRG